MDLASDSTSARRLQLLQFPGDQLQVDGERIERVAQLVRHAGGEQQDRRGLLVLDQPLGRLLFPGDVGEDDGEAPRRRAARPRPGMAPCTAARPAAAGSSARSRARPPAPPPVGQRRLERRAQAGHEPPERGAGQLALAQADEAGGGRVGIFDRAVGADDEDALVNRVEDRLEQAALPRQALHQVGEVDRVQRVEPPEHAVEGAMFSSGHGKSSVPSA